MFSLEALQAKYGDCLILHYGNKKSPKHILIDGGPSGIYKDVLKKRLEQLKPKKGGPLILELVMVSHIDRDHITGLHAMLNELTNIPQGNVLPYKILSLWHNSFDDFVITSNGSSISAEINSILPADTAVLNKITTLISNSPIMVEADVKQGRDLRNFAKKLHLDINPGFRKGIISASAGTIKKINFREGLELTILSPFQNRIDALQEEWDKTLIKLKLAKESNNAQLAETIAAEFLDKSITNLSSIVVLAELKKKKILLTGDARGDDIIQGLKNAKLLKRGKIHVDILKATHHGSDKNVSTEFFKTITANHYVISANGKYNNPDVATLEMISTARGNDNFTIHLTNKVKEADKFFKKDMKSKKYKVNYRKDSALSLEIEL